MNEIKTIAELEEDLRNARMSICHKCYHWCANDNPDTEPPCTGTEKPEDCTEWKPNQVNLDEIWNHMVELIKFSYISKHSIPCGKTRNDIEEIIIESIKLLPDDWKKKINY